MFPEFQTSLNRRENILPFQLFVKKSVLSDRVCYLTQTSNTTTQYTCKGTDINRQAKGLTIRQVVSKTDRQLWLI